MLLEQKVLKHIDEKKYKFPLYADFVSKIKRKYVEDPLNKSTFDMLYLIEQISTLKLMPLILDNDEEVIFIIDKNKKSKFKKVSGILREFGKYIFIKFKLPR